MYWNDFVPCGSPYSCHACVPFVSALLPLVIDCLNNDTRAILSPGDRQLLYKRLTLPKVVIDVAAKKAAWMQLCQAIACC